MGQLKSVLYTAAIAAVTFAVIQRVDFLKGLLYPAAAK